MFVNRQSHTRRHVRAAAFLTLLALGAAACSEDENDAVTTTAAPAPETTAGEEDGGPTTTVEQPMGDVVATALTNQVFTQLAGMAVDAGLVQALRAEDPGFTVFAPTDDAFAKIPVDVLHTIQDDPTLLETALLHHVVAGPISPDQLAEGELTSLAGTTLTVTKVGDQFFVEGNPVGAGAPG